MFERRLKFILAVLAVMTIVLVARGFHVQVVQHDHWTHEAVDSLSHKSYVETTRGQLLDLKGRPLALDAAEIDACVDFRAITPEPDATWVNEIAIKRAKSRDDYAHPKNTTRRAIVAEEIERVKLDIQSMWEALAAADGCTPDQMDTRRETIVARVQARRDNLWKRKTTAQENARKQATSAPTTLPDGEETANEEPWYRKWLDTDFDTAPALEPGDVKVAEETAAHVILPGITPEVYNKLGKDLEHFPGLVLRPGMGRHNPWNEVACHVLGRLTRVSADDLANDPNKNDPLLKYQANDLIGRGGLEALCEPLLRGKRGRIEWWTGTPNVDESTEDHAPREQVEDAKPGQDVRTTIDIDLQSEIQEAFKHVDVWGKDVERKSYADMHGAAVVIDVPTGELRAMVSAPTYNLNRFDELFSRLRTDDLEQPLLNRATQSALETGSIIKPVVGIGAITQGVMTVGDTITCTGFLIINGKPMQTGRCWTMSKWHQAGHIQPPWMIHDLNFSDALERSCNVYFENMGDRLGLDGLSHWMDAFGLGRSTGAGISERVGRLPDSIPASAKPHEKLNAKWFGGIGQQYVNATPLQMANVAATVARNGIWMRPRLVNDSVGRQLRQLASEHPTTRPSSHWYDVPDRVDLHLSPEALRAAKEGMIRVVNSEAGTGKMLARPDLLIAGKTGTAQAASFRYPERDPKGNKIIEDGQVKLIPLPASTPLASNPLAPWYLGFGEKGDEFKHSWYIGFAPAHDPKIAFAVLVEYGGSGGGAAGGIASKVVAACVEHGYLPLDHHATTAGMN